MNYNKYLNLIDRIVNRKYSMLPIDDGAVVDEVRAVIEKWKREEAKL